MTLLWRTLARAPASKLYRQQVRHIVDVRPFRQGDYVLLRSKNDRHASPILTKPLQPGVKLDTHRGAISHDDIIGRRVRDIVHTIKPKSGRQAAAYRLHEVKLEEYVRLTRRLVTPLYPQDAQLIVGLLDLHPEPPRWGEGEDDGEKLEILEAGTGHGALTLYLSKAIHAANPPIPRPTGHEEDEEADDAAIEQRKATRRAIIHSIELSPKYSAHAENIVKGFRHGLYYHNVDFHVGSVSEWTTSALSAKAGKPFLSHAFLDLPGTEHHLASVVAALRTDGTLVVFCPSITQIMACLSTVKEDDLPLELDKVIELGVNGGTGGREWDVRAVKPRAAVKAAAGAASARSEIGTDGGEDVDAGAREDSGVEVGSGDGEGVPASPSDSGKPSGEGWKMVCRPKVGELVVGGGFLGVFKKQRDMLES